VEHIYGMIKRLPKVIWEGFSYKLTKKYIKRANVDIGLMLTAYNLRIVMHIIDKRVFIVYLRIFVLTVITKTGGNIKSYKSLNYLRKSP